MATVKLDPAKGIQIPNLTTTERNAISSPETGAIIWNTTTSEINQYNGSAWEITYTPVAGITSSADATAITINSSEKVALGGSTAVTSDSQVAIHGGNLELTTAGARYWIPRASDGVLTGSLYSPSGSVVRLSGAGTSAGTIEFEPRSSNGVIARVTGDGLCFGTDTAAANALDDYEEGTWTAVFQAGGSNITASYNSSQHKASYIKVGKMVTIFLQTRTDSISGSPSGNIQIAGLPFNKAGDGAAGGHCGEAYHWNNNHPIAFTVNGDTIALNRPDANKTAITSSDLRTSNDSNQLFVSLIYRIA